MGLLGGSIGVAPMSVHWVWLLGALSVGGSIGFLFGGICASAKVADLEEQLCLASRRTLRRVK